MENFGLYVIITNPVHELEKIASLCVKYDVSMLQVRDKDGDAGDILEAYKKIQPVLAGTNTKCIINDRADLAVVCGADGLHIGQDDLHIEDVRKYFSSLQDRVIGISTHSINQAKEALEYKPDYIGFGPVFPTFAKKKPDPAVGLEQLKEVVSFSDVPVVAIGGINRSNVKSVIEAGARNIAMISALMQAEDLEQEFRYFSELMR